LYNTSDIQTKSLRIDFYVHVSIIFCSLY